MAEGWSFPYRERSLNQSTPNNPGSLRSAPLCRYYARGACAFGGRCRFSHLEPSSSRRDKRPVGHGNPGKCGNADDSASKSKSPTASPAPQQRTGSPEKSCPSGDWVNSPEFKIFPPLAELELAEDRRTHAVANVGGVVCLDPSDENKESVKKHEKDTEISKAIQRSKDKTCGICYEVIIEKAPRENKFGVLLNCNHCFCLTCIRKWRQAKHFNSKIIRGCPECRAYSDFVCPSSYWVENREDKEKLILDYKAALSSKDCKYFLKGRRRCPFGNKCFYLHAYPDGTKADVGPPVWERRQNIDAEVELHQYMFLWEFIEDWANEIPFMEDDGDAFDTSSNSDDSDDFGDWLDRFFL